MIITVYINNYFILNDRYTNYMDYSHKRAARLQEDAGVTGEENDCVDKGLYIHV